MIDRTDHRVLAGDARDLPLPDDSVELVVTSPPYPMIELWDETFRALGDEVGTALDAGDGSRAFELMHRCLRDAWAEVERVLAPGGIACVDVGDAVRTLEQFREYPNGAAVTEAFEDLGLSPLPGIVWRKPANSAAKFMGSGMRPPNAYVTLEHEQILVFRNGGCRRPDPERRDESAYFWAERNQWFSDLWEVRGERQALDGTARERTAAFPFEIPYRLINMFSVQGETMLDPFLGTGTTTLAAMASARDSVGVEREASLVEGFGERVDGVRNLTRRERLRTHERSLASEDRDPGYEAVVYDVPVMTRGERHLRLPAVVTVDEQSCGDGGRRYAVEHGTWQPERSRTDHYGDS